MMDELISEVCTKTGLSQDQARSAVDAVIGLLKTRLPAPLASRLDGLVGGSASVVADGGGVETKREPKAEALRTKPPHCWEICSAIRDEKDNDSKGASK